MGQRLLLADSNIFEMDKVRSILEKGYEVRVAYNAKAAFAIIESEKIDMVFADIKMTMPDGKSLFSTIKESFRKVGGTSHYMCKLSENNTTD